MRDPYDIVINPRVTEKGTTLAEAGQYVFKVATNATKVEIKYAIKQIFKKDAVRVNTLHVLGKKKRERTRNFGKKPDWKKAIVTLKAGEKIDLV